MDNLEKKREMQAACDVIESEVSKTSEVLNEAVSVSNRSGRGVQSAHGLDAQSALASDRTALGVHGCVVEESGEVIDEAASISNRRGRKGRSSAARLGGDAASSPQSEDTNDSHRLTINGAAEQALTGAVERVNDGFQGGKLNRNQLAIWAILRFAEHLDDSEVRDIRAEYLDEFSAIDAVLRRAKEIGQLPPELKAFVQKQMGFDDAPRKRSKKELS